MSVDRLEHLCFLNIEYYDPKYGYWNGRIGSGFDDLIRHARLSEKEWVITTNINGYITVIAQSKNWRERTGAH